MCGAFGIAGWYFGTKPTSVTSESNVRIGDASMPWEGDDDEGKVFKYQYHPHGDKNQALRNAPSAVNTVIVPDVTLPEVSGLDIYIRWMDILVAWIPVANTMQSLHEQFNKYGKEEYDY